MNPDRCCLLATALAKPAALIGLAACDQRTETILVPAEANVATIYDLGGMLATNYPEPKVQLYYQGNAAPCWCCDTAGMFNTLFKPEQARGTRVALVQDMDQID